MHNLAIALHKKGMEVTGSDDEVFEPAKSRLNKYGLLPKEAGWHVENIHSGLDAIILGMHARIDNPELLKSQEMGLKIYSYPEYIYEQTKDKKRVVIGGSHGKTTITAIILHVLQFHKINCDYLVGAQLDGFDTMVKLTEDAPIAILEGDEYLSSPIDRRPKFHLYKPDIALLSGIAWDHINVFPTFENYVEQFRIFVNQISDDGSLIYCETDEEVENICEPVKRGIRKLPYTIPEHTIENGITYLTISASHKIPLQIFGDHNLSNISGARLVCNQLGVSDVQFYEAISSFKGAANRLELIGSNETTTVYKDFAHSPSKVRATISALKDQFPGRRLVACLELHTFSSLNEEFLMEFLGTMKKANIAIVYLNPETISHKKLKPISNKRVMDAFGNNNLMVYTDSDLLIKDLKSKNWKNTNLLIMSSGNFDGMDFEKLAELIIPKQLRFPKL